MKYKVFEVGFEGCTPYSQYVIGYYGLDGVIYDIEGRVVPEEEVAVRNLEIDYGVGYLDEIN